MAQSNASCTGCRIAVLQSLLANVAREKGQGPPKLFADLFADSKRVICRQLDLVQIYLLVIPPTHIRNSLGGKGAMQSTQTQVLVNPFQSAFGRNQT